MSAFEHDPALSRYIDRVRAIPTLDRDEEMALARRAVAGDPKASQALVEANLRYAVAVALQYRRYGIRLSELVAEGNMGLMMAVRKFDPELGHRFVTYAGYWIRAYVLDCVVRNTSMVGAGSGPLRSKVFFRLRRERARLQNLLADPDERVAALAASFGVTSEKMAGMLQRLDARDMSLDQPVYNDSATTVLDTLEDRAPAQDDALAAAEENETVRERLRAALSLLDRRERFIVEKRLMDDDSASLASIGRTLGVSRERARQLEARAKKKLQKSLEGLVAA